MRRLWGLKVAEVEMLLGHAVVAGRSAEGPCRVTRPDTHYTDPWTVSSAGLWGIGGDMGAKVRLAAQTVPRLQTPTE